MEQLQELALNRSGVYAFLSQFYNTVPREEFVNRLRSEDFLEKLREVSQLADGELSQGVRLLEQFLQTNSSRDNEQLTTELAVEFTRLFRGIKPEYGPPPPYESVYRDEGRVVGACTEEVLGTYLKAGLALGEEYGGPPDYIGTELKFLSLAAYREAENWEKDRLEAVRLLRLEEEFIREHALAWIPKFCQVVLKEAQSEFYRDIAKITRGFLRLDASQLRKAILLMEEAK
jgi:TorA maturation chaperone TorD